MPIHATPKETLKRFLEKMEAKEKSRWLYISAPYKKTLQTRKEKTK